MTFVSGLLFSFVSFPELFTRTVPPSPTSHCTSWHLLALLLHPSLRYIFCSQEPSAFCTLLHRPPRVSRVTPETVSFCCALIIFSTNLASCSGPMRLNHQSQAGPGQFERWLKIRKRRNSHAHCSSRLQRWRNETPGGLARTRRCGSV